MKKEKYRLTKKFVCPSFVLSQGEIITITPRPLGNYILKSDEVFCLITEDLKNFLLKSCEICQDPVQKPTRVSVSCFWEISSITLDISVNGLRSGLDMTLDEAEQLIKDLEKSVQTYKDLDNKLLENFLKKEV